MSINSFEGWDDWCHVDHNERYSKSLEANDDDDDDDDNYTFDITAFNNRRDRENIKLKTEFDNLCLNSSGKKVFFRLQNDRSSPVYPNIEKFFTDVLKVDDSVAHYKGLTLNFESFKDFFSDNFKSPCVKEVITIGSKRDLLYIYFQDVYISKCYMIFNIDIYSNQGGWRSSIGEHQHWRFSSDSYDSPRKIRPDVVYEDFKDILMCNLD